MVIYFFTYLNYKLIFNSNEILGILNVKIKSQFSWLKNPANLYQYVLNFDEVFRIYKNIGFLLKYRYLNGGIIGFKDEILILKYVIKKFLDV